MLSNLIKIFSLGQDSPICVDVDLNGAQRRGQIFYLSFGLLMNIFTPGFTKQSDRCLEVYPP
jgi:hypothetical protein